MRLTREDSSESEKKERLDVRWFLDGTAKYNLKNNILKLKRILEQSDEKHLWIV